MSLHRRAVRGADAASDGVQNGNETDVDCGGADCPRLRATGKKCANSGTNCQTRSAPTTLCQAPTCTDGVKNGDETDIDCGGGSYMGFPACPPCNPGQKCNVPSDCVGGDCQTTCQCPMGMLAVPIQAAASTASTRSRSPTRHTTSSTAPTPPPRARTR